eukprot:scaffold3945_cov105-Isochrysis_galbana.AAC.19
MEKIVGYSCWYTRKVASACPRYSQTSSIPPAAGRSRHQPTATSLCRRDLMPSPISIFLPKPSTTETEPESRATTMVGTLRR